jgi:hypothetical protein
LEVKRLNVAYASFALELQVAMQKDFEQPPP